jgi:hypothetical protein
MDGQRLEPPDRGGAGVWQEQDLTAAGFGEAA